MGALERIDAVVDDPPFEPARLVDDPLEEAGHRLAAERPFRGDASDVRQHFLLAVGLIDLDALRLLQAADLADAARPLVQQPNEHFVDTIDVLAADRQEWKWSLLETLSPFNHRT